MKAIFKGAMMASVLAMGFGLSACDSKQENAAEDQADAVRETGEKKADAMEDQADKMDKTPG